MFLCVTYCQVLYIGLKLSDTSSLMKLSYVEDLVTKDSDLIHLNMHGFILGNTVM